MPQSKKAAVEEQEEPQVATQTGSTAEGGALPSARREDDVKIPRSDDDALTDLFANIVSGEYAPRYVVVGRTLERDDDGYPKTVEVRTRDDRDEMLVVDYADLRPAAAGQR